ncbi:MAG: aminoglycoside phosphotransferase family protein, partial [Minisyncoccia bacterium]
MAREIIDEEKVAAFLHDHGFKDCHFSRVESGVSTNVFKLEREGKIFFLRIMKEGESATTQTLAHKLMREKSANVPTVVNSADDSAELGSPYMVVEEIGGTDLETQTHENEGHNFDQVMFSAGADLARINSVPVRGFGKVQTSESDQNDLEAPFENNEELTLYKIDKILGKLQTGSVVSPEIADVIKQKIEKHMALLSCDQAVLNHGDMDLSHIFSKDGKYTGIIDFGDMRGASPVYDLAYFRYKNGDEHMPKLIEGYQSFKSLPENHHDRIQLEGMLIA